MLLKLINVIIVKQQGWHSLKYDLKHPVKQGKKIGSI